MRNTSAATGWESLLEMITLLNMLIETFDINNRVHRTPVACNFKVQRSSTANTTGASIKQKMLHWCRSKTRNYEVRSVCESRA